jgi:hypothetical protein
VCVLVKTILDEGFNPPATERANRRRSQRGTARGGPSRAQLVSLIVGTYGEMPGLSLHVNQAARLLGLDETTCRVVLDDLVGEGLLRRADDGQYRRP